MSAPIIIEERLVIIKSYGPFIADYPDIDLKIASIVEYDIDSGDIILKTIDGVTVKNNLKLLEKPKLFPRILNIGKAISIGNNYKIEHGFLKCDTPNILVCSEIMSKIKAVVNTADGKALLLFKDGKIAKFRITSNYILEMDGERININSKLGGPVYCQDGLMERIEIDNIYRDEINIGPTVVRTINGEFYAFYANACFAMHLVYIYKLGDTIILRTDVGIALGGIKLGIKPDNVVLSKIVSLWPFNYPYIIKAEAFANVPEFTKISQNGDKLYVDDDPSGIDILPLNPHPKFKEIKLVYNNSIKFTHYINNDGLIIKYSPYMYKYGENYYSSRLSKLEVFPAKLPVNDAYIVGITAICDLNGSFTINNQFPVVGPIAQNIKNIDILGEFGIYSLLITMKSDEPRKCCLVHTSSQMLFVFEDGEVAPLRVPDVYYSKNGPYKLLTPAEYEKISDGLYQIRGNLVIFDTRSDPTYLYESFGDYMILGGTPIFGVIAVHSRPKHTKPAHIEQTATN